MCSSSTGPSGSSGASTGSTSILRAMRGAPSTAARSARAPAWCLSRGAQWWSGYLRIACSRHQVRTAPESSGDVLIDGEDADALREHYSATAARGRERRAALLPAGLLAPDPTTAGRTTRGAIIAPRSRSGTPTRRRAGAGSVATDARRIRRRRRRDPRDRPAAPDRRARAGPRVPGPARAPRRAAQASPRPVAAPASRPAGPDRPAASGSAGAGVGSGAGAGSGAGSGRGRRDRRRLRDEHRRAGRVGRRRRVVGRGDHRCGVGLRGDIGRLRRGDADRGRRLQRHGARRQSGRCPSPPSRRRRQTGMPAP